jgi:hypothetical protein
MKLFRLWHKNLGAKMKNIISITLISLLLIACSTTKKKHLVEMDGVQNIDVPKWVYAPQEGCNESEEICASAEGENSAISDTNARNSLGSIFESNVKSNFLLEKYGYSNAEASSLTERVASEVSETVDVVLNSVSIKNRFKKDGLSFSLASLNRLNAAESLREEIKSLDDKIEFLYKKGNKSSIIKMHLLFDKREQINQKIIVITGNSIKTEMSFSKISKLKYVKKSGNRIIVKAVNAVPRTLKKWIESLLTDSGYKVVEDSNIDFIVKIKYFVDEEFMKVKGFKKFSFSIIIEGKNNNGDKLGVFKVEEIGTGRTKQNAYLKIKKKLQDRIKSNLDKINLK